MNKVKIFLFLAMVILAICTTIDASAQSQIISGLKTPRLTEVQRDQINVTGNDAAKGLVIYNTTINKLQFWNGVEWVNVGDSIEEIVENISNNITNQFIDSIINHINYNTLVDSISNHITNQFGDSVWNHMNYNTVIDSLANYVTQEFTDGVMSNVTISGQHGITINGSGTSNITVGLSGGNADGQILEWSTADQEWKVANNKNVKQLEITLAANNILSTESMIFTGLSSVSTNQIQILSVQPVFTGNVLMRKTMLAIDATAEENSGAIEWLINVKNNNIDSTVNCTLNKVIVSYICNDDLTSVSTQSYINVGW
ncbi:MAG: hypothetical protein LBV69_06255 [Bacteroidales bacterium]|jgi:hypothetical protein|nr:hypothetical protein [Bacteroidales bacterium]